MERGWKALTYSIMAIFTNNFREFKREAHELIDQAESTGSTSKIPIDLEALLEIHNVKIDRLKFRIMVERLATSGSFDRARKLIDIFRDDSLKDWAVHSIRVGAFALYVSASAGIAVGVVYLALWLYN